ncbi:hypothetical protein GJ496_001472 [Pomphorhynchus laevis]|nr:hypothetical protein GJ496_001472 [Pomphorhynchus laevis]
MNRSTKANYEKHAIPLVKTCQESLNSACGVQQGDPLVPPPCSRF